MGSLLCLSYFASCLRPPLPDGRHGDRQEEVVCAMCAVLVVRLYSALDTASASSFCAG
jgi:hypothetical protein